MNTIEHTNIFELLSVDLDLPTDHIRDLLHSKGTSDFIGFLKKRDLWIHKTELILETEIKDSFGKVLINSGIDLNKYLSSLLDRYVKDSDFRTSSFHIGCTSEVLTMYRSRAYEKVNSIMDAHIYSQDGYQSLFEDIPCVKENFECMIDQIVETPKGICALLKILTNFDMHKELILNSLNSSVVTLSLSSIASGKVTESEKRLSLKTGMACILQNMDSITGTELCDSTSTEIIRMLIGDDALEQAVIMNSSATYESAPVFTDSVNRTNYYLRTLATVGLFVDLVYQNKTDVHNLEVHKSLYELCEQGYADREITRQLGKLFLPEAKYLVLEYAYRIKNKCTYKPVIWSSVGDMLPVKFICSKGGCDYCGSHKTYIPKDVKVKTGNVCIVAGLYFTCSKLTDELQKYYKEVVRASSVN